MERTGEAQSTRERLLREAEILFARKGYHAVSVREITDAAGCNLASVNYHFKNKESLYIEVFRSLWLQRAAGIRRRFEEKIRNGGPESLETVIRCLAEAFLEGPLTDEERLLHAQLVIREIIQPTEAFQVIFQFAMKPFLTNIAGRLRPFLPAGMSEEDLLLHVFSVFSMVLYFNFARTAISQLVQRSYDPDFIRTLISHIVRFSLHGLDPGKPVEPGPR
jgi:AcrR family transcriptional regulator